MVLCVEKNVRGEAESFRIASLILPRLTRQIFSRFHHTATIPNAVGCVGLVDETKFYHIVLQQQAEADFGISTIGRHQTGQNVPVNQETS